MKALILAAAVLLTGFGSANLEEAKAKACARWAEVGYQCVGYEGYTWGIWVGGKYGGARVWHTLKRVDNPSVIYTGFVQFWGDELHIYGPTAIDAIKGGN